MNWNHFVFLCTLRFSTSEIISTKRKDLTKSFEFETVKKSWTAIVFFLIRHHFSTWKKIWTNIKNSHSDYFQGLTEKFLSKKECCLKDMPNKEKISLKKMTIFFFSKSLPTTGFEPQTWDLIDVTVIPPAFLPITP